LMAAQAGADTAFPTAALTVEDDVAAADLAQAWADGRRRDLAAGRTLVGPHRADMVAVYAAKGIAAGRCSTGEQKALLISLILANARALTADLGAAPVLLLDEVAAHLDAGRRAALYDEICALGAQAMMSGTEAGLFDTLGARAQVVTVTETDGLSVVAM
jgi:DNA replication and repair protein RecF